MAFNYPGDPYAGFIPVAPLPGIAGGFNKSVAVAIGTNVYLFGGHDATANTNLAYIWMYDTVANAWTQKAAIPAGATQGMWAVAYDATHIVFGGGDGAGTGRETYTYDTVGNTVSTKAAAPVILDNCSSIFYGGKVVVFGATNGNIYTYNTTSDVWDNGTTYIWTNGQASGLVPFVINSKMYVYGGSYTSGLYSNKGFVWNTNTNAWDPTNLDTWATMGSMIPNSGIGDAIAVSYSNYVLFVGGTNSNATTINGYNYVIRFTPTNPSGAQFAFERYLPTSMQYPAAAAVLNGLYVFGGDVTGTLSKNFVKAAEINALTTRDILNIDDYPIQDGFLKWDNIAGYITHHPALGDLVDFKETSSTPSNPLVGEVWLDTGSIAALQTGYYINPMASLGDMIYGDTHATPTRLPAGTTGQLLTMSASTPVWARPTPFFSESPATPVGPLANDIWIDTGTISALQAGAYINPMAALGDIIYGDIHATPTRLAIGTTGQLLTVSGSTPVWTRPTPFFSESPATPVGPLANDIWIDTGTISALQAGAYINPMAALGDIIYGDIHATPTRLSIGTTGQLLTVSGSTPVWARPTPFFSESPATPVGPTFNDIWIDTGTTYVSQQVPFVSNPMTTLGDMMYANASATPIRLPIGSTGQVLTVSNNQPTWQNPTSASIALALLRF